MEMPTNFKRFILFHKFNHWCIYLKIISIITFTFQLNAQHIKGDSAEIQEAIKLLSNYIQINSETGNERQAALFFADKCNALGLQVKFLTNDSGSYNFIASIYPLSDGKPNIVFFNHIDVVGPGNENDWKYPPYSGKIIDNKVWGRGALDNKGLAVIQLYSVLNAYKKSLHTVLPYNVSVLCVSGEESGGEHGSARVASEFIKEINPAVMLGEGGSGYSDLSFIPEGKTLFGISIAEKGVLKLKLSTEVESNGHSSIVGGDYANKRLINALYNILNWEQKIDLTKEVRLMFKSIGEVIGGTKGFALKNIHCAAIKPALKRTLNRNPELEGMFKNTLAINSIGHLSGDRNVISQKAEALVDCRLLPGVTQDKFLTDLKSVINDHSIKVEIMNKYQERYTSPPDFYFEQLSIAIKQIFKNTEVVPMLFPAYNDNAHFRKYGCPTFGINPMIVSKKQLGAIHNIDEFIDFEDIVHGISIFTQFIEKVIDSHTDIRTNIGHL